AITPAALLLRSNAIRDQLHVWAMSRIRNTHCNSHARQQKRATIRTGCCSTSPGLHIQQSVGKIATYTAPQKHRPTLLAGVFYGRADNVPPTSGTDRPLAIGS